MIHQGRQLVTHSLYININNLQTHYRSDGRRRAVQYCECLRIWTYKTPAWRRSRPLTSQGGMPSSDWWFCSGRRAGLSGSPRWPCPDVEKDGTHQVKQLQNHAGLQVFIAETGGKKLWWSGQGVRNVSSWFLQMIAPFVSGLVTQPDKKDVRWCQISKMLREPGLTKDGAVRELCTMRCVSSGGVWSHLPQQINKTKCSINKHKSLVQTQNRCVKLLNTIKRGIVAGTPVL